ncbi:MAG: hypothetical protein OXG33_03175 [Chloroflexi bacterium]|nr:hypothetical protein [Chloroflexota bacterium]
MTVDSAVLPGLLLLAAEVAALAAVGYVIVRVALRQDDERMALAQGLVVGPALWGLIVNFVLYAVPGLAGAAVGWGVVIAIGVGLAWRTSHRVRPPARLLAGFVVAVLALLWASLASRQLMGIPDPEVHMGLAAFLRSGGFPPEMSWTAGVPVRYHHAIDLLVGLLAPPVGPDLAFVTELLGVYAWTSFVLIVITALLRHASPVVVVAAAPLLLANGLWTWASGDGAVLQVPIPAGLPEANLGASLGDVYWPPVELAPEVRLADLLPDSGHPSFPLGYALTFVVLERVARLERWSWRASVTVAGLVGFMGLVATTILAPLVIGWAGLAGWHLIRTRRSGAMPGDALRLGAGFALAGILLLGGGGTLTRILDGAPSSGLELALGLHPRDWQVLGTLDARPGGVGVLGIGPLALAGAAVVLARRDRLVVALTAAAALLVLAWIWLHYPPAPWDLNRLAGHARNLALVALLLAAAVRLGDFRPTRARYAAAVVAILVTWPTVVAPVRSLGLAIGHGVQLANATWVQEHLIDQGVAVPMRRFRMPQVSARVADYIQRHTPTEARILAPEGPSWAVSAATGRPNNAGLAGLTYLVYHFGPEYADAADYLEPAAIRRLGIDYVHTTDAWISALPRRAQSWLADPQLFELLVKDGDERLYRVRRAFVDLDVSPNPKSFEALRQSVPPSAAVYIVAPPREPVTLRVASAVSHARLVGEVDPLFLHLQPPAKWHVAPLTTESPDFVALPTGVEPWMFPLSARSPIWWRDDVAVYAPNGAAPRIMDAPVPEVPPPGEPPVLVEVTAVEVAAGRVEFAAAFDERTSQGWTSQDWVVLEGDLSPWAIPTETFRRGHEPTIAKWIAGLLSAGSATSAHDYRFDARTFELSVRNDAGDFVPLASSAVNLGPGGYTLALRLRHEYEPNHWRDAAVIPVLRIRIAESGDVAYEPLDDVLGGPVP